MSTTNNFRPLLHRKLWDFCSLPGNTAATAGISGVKSRLHDQLYYLLRAASLVDLYDPFNDAWGALPAVGLGTFVGGACCEYMPMGPSGTATAGSATTLTTNLTIPIDLRGYKIRITGGPGNGDEKTIISNTLGANAVITVDSPFSATITSSSTYTLVTGRLYLFGAGTLVASSFRVFDFATQTFSSLTSTGLPASFTSDGCLVGTPSIVELGEVCSFATGTASGALASTLVNSAKTWATNQWTGAYQVRITGGTGAGQVRRISSNTGTTISVTSNWTVTPDATSTYSIEGDDDSLYLLGNSAVTAYRYSISGNSWSTITPSVARAGSPSTGMCAYRVSTADAVDWTDESNIRNGRRIYSFRGGGFGPLDYYDIPSNSWVNALAYGPATIQPAVGWRYAERNGKIYIRNSGITAAAQQWYVYDCVTNKLLPWAMIPMIVNFTLNAGNTPFIAVYKDGSTEVPYLYAFSENSSFIQFMRCMIP